jgi:hypothetical protein
MDAMLRAFNDHPQSVGETYLSHLGSATRFSGMMLVGALACLIHGLLPFLFQTTGSRQIRRLHDAMVTNRRLSLPAGEGGSPPKAARRVG